MKNRTLLPLLLVVLAGLPACSSDGDGGVALDANAVAAQIGPILQRCTETHTLNLLAALDALLAILDDPPPTFDLPIDLDGDGTPDVTIAGTTAPGGGAAVSVTWSLAGALAGNGTLTATVQGDGRVVFSGTGMISDPADPDACTFEFDLEEVTLAPPAPAVAGAATCATGGGTLVETVSIGYQSSIPSQRGVDHMSGAVGCQQNQYCSASPIIAIALAQVSWPAFCFAAPANLTAIGQCATDQVALLAGFVADAAAFLQTAQTGIIPPFVTFGPILQTAEPFDFLATFPANSFGAETEITAIFPSDPTQGLAVGDTIDVSVLFLGNPLPSGSLSGRIRVGAQGFFFEDIEGSVALGGNPTCTLNFTISAAAPLELAVSAQGDLTDVSGRIAVEALVGNDTFTANLDFREGSGGIDVLDAFLNGNPVPNVLPILGVGILPSPF